MTGPVCEGAGRRPVEVLAGNSTGVTGRCPVCRRAVTLGRHTGLIGKHKPRSVGEPSDLERALLHQCHMAGLPAPAREYLFAVPGQAQPWRFDLAWPDHMLAVEVQGAVWTGGRHSSGAGQQNDHAKLNAAQLAGWTVLQYSRKPILDGVAVTQIGQALR